MKYLIYVDRWQQWGVCNVRGRCVGDGGGILILFVRCKVGEKQLFLQYEVGIIVYLVLIFMYYFNLVCEIYVLFYEGCMFEFIWCIIMNVCVNFVVF